MIYFLDFFPKFMDTKIEGPIFSLYLIFNHCVCVTFRRHLQPQIACNTSSYTFLKFY
jgi:hypothetical protein